MKSTRQRGKRRSSRQHLSSNVFRLLFSLFLISSTPLPSSASTNGIGISCWRRYKSCLAKRPLLTKSSTSSVVMAISDALCQRFEATGAGRGRKGEWRKCDGNARQGGSRRRRQSSRLAPELAHRHHGVHLQQSDFPRVVQYPRANRPRGIANGWKNNVRFPPRR